MDRHRENSTWKHRFGHFIRRITEFLSRISSVIHCCAGMCGDNAVVPTKFFESAVVEVVKHVAINILGPQLFMFDVLHKLSNDSCRQSLLMRLLAPCVFSRSIGRFGITMLLKAPAVTIGLTKGSDELVRIWWFSPI